MNIINWFEAHAKCLEFSRETRKCTSDLVDKIILVELDIYSRVCRKVEIRKKRTQFTHTYY